MIPIVISFFLGIISLHFFSELPNIIIVLTFVIIFGILSFLPEYQKLQKCRPKLLFSFFIGFFWVLLNAHWIRDHSIPSEIETKPIIVVGIVDSIPEFRDNTMQFHFDIQYTLPKSLWLNPGRVKLRLRDKAIPLHVGEQLQLTVKLKRPHGYANPGSVDTERHLFLNRIVAEGTVVNKGTYQRLDDSFLRHPIDRLRMWFRDNISIALKNSPYVGIINALVIGVQSGISMEQWKVLKETGTVHLVAIAGLHIAFVTGFVMFIMLHIWRRLPVQYLKIPLVLVTAVAGLSAAFFYALLAGFSTPTQRAVVMMSAFMLSMLVKRQAFVWQSYFLALGIVLLLDPLSTLAPGFWLSFGAVGIIIFSMKGRLDPKGLWWKWGRIQCVLFLGLTPLLFAIFGSTSLISPLANFIAIPWVGFLILPFCLLGTLCLIFNSALGAAFLKIAAGSLALLWPILQRISELPISTWQHAGVEPWSLGLAFAGIIFLLLPRGFPAKKIGFVFLLPLFLIKPLEIEPNTARITVLDVGQGLATVVETQHHVLVFDTGPKLNANFDTGDRVVLPFLATRNRQHIDALVISHGDNDHAGGARSILQALKVKTIITSEPKLFPEFNTQPCMAGKHWTWDGVFFEILHPIHFFTKKRNDHSCVLKITTGTQSMLLTADIEAKSEYQLLQDLSQKLSATVMLVPHHGSRTSSTLEFIRAVNPEFAIIPVGYLNQYGHPKPDIVERYKNEKIRLFDTVREGAITVTLDPEKSVNIQRYRAENRRYWHSLE